MSKVSKSNKVKSNEPKPEPKTTKTKTIELKPEPTPQPTPTNSPTTTTDADTKPSLHSLKKRYSYYKHILETKKALNERQQKAYDDLLKILGDNLPQTRNAKLTDEERKMKRREYYNNHKEQIIAYSSTWNKNNKERVAQYNRKSYEKRKLNQKHTETDSTPSTPSTTE